MNAAGERVGRKRIRYVCYNKTRKRCDCKGQTGYTMHILDKMITEREWMYTPITAFTSSSTP